MALRLKMLFQLASLFTCANGISMEAEGITNSSNGNFKAQVNVGILGSAGVGKSALTIRQTTGNIIEDYDPTIEDSYTAEIKVDGTKYDLNILDTSGQEEYSHMQDEWIRQCDCFIIVYDMTNEKTFDEVRLLHDKILETKEIDEVPMVLVGNKSDLKNEREVSFDQGKELANEWGCPWFYASAQNKHLCGRPFYSVIREIVRLQPADSPALRPKSTFRFGL